VRRIAVIGSGGAGKSTLARRLGAALGIEVTHLDRLYWRPGWVATPADEWRAIQRELVARDAWIIDGNYGSTLDLRLAAADTVVFLDLPRLTCVRQVLQRRLRSRLGRDHRANLGDAVPDRVTWEFLRWVWAYPRVQRPRVLEKLARYGDGRRVVMLRSRADIERFLAEARPAAGPPGAPRG